MGVFYNFRKFPRTAVEKSREKRVREARALDKSCEEFQKSPEVLRAKELVEEKKLKELREFRYLDQKMYPQFGEEIERAEDKLSAKMGEGGEGQEEDEEEGEAENSLDKLLSNEDRLLDDSEEADLSFDTELISEGDNLLNPPNKRIGLSETDNQRFGDFLEVLKSLKRDIQKHAS